MKRTIYKFLAGILVFSIILGTSSCLKNNQYYINFTAVAPSVEMAMAPAKAVNPPNVFSGSYSRTLGSALYFDTVNYLGNDTMPVYVNVASPAVPTSATKVTLALDTVDFDTYNSQFGGVNVLYWGFLGLPPPQQATIGNGYFAVPNGDGLIYEVLPDSCYSVSSWIVTVPANQRLAPLNVVVNVNKIDTTTTFITDPNINGGAPTQVPNHTYVLPVTIQSASLTVSYWKTVFVQVALVSF